jgi:hypothetical protein
MTPEQAHHRMLIDRLAARATSVLAAEELFKMNNEKFKSDLLVAMNVYIEARQQLDEWESLHPVLDHPTPDA